MRQSLLFLAWAGMVSLGIPVPVTHAVTIPTVPIGNPGNPADMRFLSFSHPDGVGSVGYQYRIGKTEITNAQYVEFLNAVAATDPYELYNAKMADYEQGGIVRSGVSGSFTYQVKAAALGGAYSYHNKPVNHVSFGDAMRFANWLHHGQPSGAQGPSTTEDGAYTLNGALTFDELFAITRNAHARWWLPSEDEWYKAAYHKNDGVTGNYWNFPTATNSTPNNNLPSSDTGNSANYYDTNYATGSMPYPLTDAGAYKLSDSAYGTFDQGGSLWEWNELKWSGRGVRGGAWFDGWNFLRAADWNAFDPRWEVFQVGIRVASAIPEPGTGWLLGLAFAGGLVRRRRAAPNC
jgi:sulfatase modifying factor 1